jgi:hypothetical protein
MSNSPHENHQRAAELHDSAAHAHRIAEQHENQDRLTAAEHSRQALEQSDAAHQQTRVAARAHGVNAFGHSDVATLAQELWQARGCPKDSSDQDWFQAARELRARGAAA